MLEQVAVIDRSQAEILEQVYVRGLNCVIQLAAVRCHEVGHTVGNSLRRVLLSRAWARLIT